MPIEIHCSSLVDEQGQQRSRPPPSSHPILRAHDCCYVSRPEHLTALLHLKVFRTTPSLPHSSPATHSATDSSPASSDQDQDQEQDQEQDLFSPIKQKQEGEKRLLGKEFLESQREARLLAAAGKKKRRVQTQTQTQVKVSTRSSMGAEVKRQEAHLAKVLDGIRCTREDKERIRHTEEIISGKIDQRTEEKMKLSLGRPMGAMLVAQTREQTIEWALKVAKQPDSTVKKELYAVLDQVRKYMVLYGGGAAARATTTARGRSSLESSRGASSKMEFMEMLQDIPQTGVDDNLSLSEKLAKQETRGLARFVMAISPASAHGSASARLRRTINRRTIIASFSRKPSNKARTSMSIGLSIPTIHESVREDKPASASAATSPRRNMQENKKQPQRPFPPGTRPQSANSVSTTLRRRSTRSGSSSKSLATTYQADKLPSKSESVPSPPKDKPNPKPPPSSLTGGIKFTRSPRKLAVNVKPQVSAVEAVTPVVPIIFNTTAHHTPKMRSMSVMSTQINAAGEEEDVIMTKLLRVDGGSGEPEKELPTVIDEEDDDEESEDDDDDESEEGCWNDRSGSVGFGKGNGVEDVGANEKGARLDSTTPLKRYTNNPEYKWNSNDFYTYNDMLGIDEFHEGAVKLYNQMHESREMAIEDNKKIMAEMAATTGSVLEKLVSRFVSHHELQDSHLDSMLHTLAEKDFHRPVVMQRLRKAISEKVEEGSMHQHVLDELQQINKLVKYSIHINHMKNLVKNKWFLKIIHGLQAYKRKMKAAVPDTLPRFLLAASKLLENNEKIDEALFYVLVEKLLAPQDQKHVIVHRSLSLFRKGIGLGSEEYSKYLEKLNITPCPELIAELRELRRKKNRQLRVQETRERTESTASAATARERTESTASVGTIYTKPDNISETEHTTQESVAAEIAALSSARRISESAPTSLYSSASPLIGRRPRSSQGGSNPPVPSQMLRNLKLREQPEDDDDDDDDDDEDEDEDDDDDVEE